MQPRLNIAINSLKYIYAHQENFEATFIIGFMCFYKLLNEFLIEVLQIAVSFFIDDSLYVIMSFTALVIIQQTDEIYFGAI